MCVAVDIEVVELSLNLVCIPVLEVIEHYVMQIHTTDFN